MTQYVSSTPSSHERLSFTIFLALAIHGMLIFGLTFDSKQPSESAPSVTVTLATHSSTIAPENADFLAQSNQLGSGSEQNAKEITTDVISPFDSASINDTLLAKQQKRVVQAPDNSRVITSLQSPIFVNNIKAEDGEKGDNSDEDANNINSVNAQITSLKAKLAKQRQAYAKIPRERVLTSVSTLASSEAEYLNQWTQRIESIGNAHFPKEALRQKITGKLRLQVVIKQDGTIREVNLMQPSGYKIFDDSALQIIHQAAPFAPLPAKIRKDYDHIVIIRTWHFDIKGLTTQ